MRRDQEIAEGRRQQELAAAEMRRQQELAAAEARRQQEIAAQIERERIAEEQRQKQARINTAQQGVQGLIGMVPQMYQNAQETTTPLYSTMEYFDPFGDPFADRKMMAASTTKPTEQTKMAQGGYLDTMLAEEMSVDDLLNLLR
jgi:multidrug efflux pump subunit AcrA (membrane-fusion protein)